MAPVLALLSAVAYGAADFLGGMAARKATAVAAVVVSQTAGLILLLLALPLLPETIVNPIDIAWGAVAGLAGGSGVALLYRALALGPMSVVAPLTAVFAAAVPVFTGLALGERLSMVTTLGIALAAIAIVLIGQEQDQQSTDGPRSRFTVYGLTFSHRLEASFFQFSPGCWSASSSSAWSARPPRPACGHSCPLAWSRSACLREARWRAGARCWSRGQLPASPSARALSTCWPTPCF